MSPAGTKKTQRPIGTQKYCRFCERTENGSAAKQQYIALCPRALMVAPAVAHLGPGPPAHLQTARRNRSKKPSQDPSQDPSQKRPLVTPTSHHNARKHQHVMRKSNLCTAANIFVYRIGVPICVPIGCTNLCTNWCTKLCTNWCTNLCTVTKICVHQFVYRDKGFCVP